MPRAVRLSSAMATSAYSAPNGSAFDHATAVAPTAVLGLIILRPYVGTSADRRALEDPDRDGGQPGGEHGDDGEAEGGHQGRAVHAPDRMQPGAVAEQPVADE